MMRFVIFLRRGGVAIVAAALCLRMLGDRTVQASPAPMAFVDAMPRTVVWAWEEPEDLRSADPQAVGVAYLAETLLLGEQATIRPRHQPLAVAPRAAVMAVVRIETQAGFHDTPELRLQTANALAEVSSRPGLRALQIDFDVTPAERHFYATMLQQLRPQMPVGMPLSITALTSWCAAGGSGWLASLPIDEAVPMFFRLGGHTRPYADKSARAIREPLCRGSLGLSTDESWPSSGSAPATARRVYLFSPKPWQPAQLLAVASLRLTERPHVLRVRDDPASIRAGINDTGLHPRINPSLSSEAQP